MNYKTDISYRKESLKKLLHFIVINEEAIIEALYLDFKKCRFEAVVTETSYVISDLKHTIKNINSWAKPKRVLPSILNFPSQDFIYNEPYGKILIIAPWNYPFQLVLCPLIAAVAAGNQVVVKPSELTPNTSAIISQILNQTFDKNHVDVIEGGIEVATALLTQRWDYIFFTGSVEVGKIVAQSAAQFLTPVTLELGGKNPCIIDDSAELQLAAKRIVWGKFVNAGQTCIAPDYILIQATVKEKFISFLKDEITNAYGENPEFSPDFSRIINSKNWYRLSEMLNGSNIIFGGQTNEETLYISPTLIDEPSENHALMKGEIFGPLLPIIAFENEAAIQKIISKYEKPLALYVFSKNSKFSRKIIQEYSFGGGCINDTMVHFANKRLPFGGVGHSGIGSYHGRFGFDTFTHKKSIVKKGNWIDIPIRYAPYKDKINFVRKLLKWL
ncbi:MAG: aldehyde dehydrogenase [Flavobacterium sp.]|nr:aldehyde dehydrogenase [Flavobacterium sp.]